MVPTPIIAPTIPPSPDYTPASPDYSPASETESDPSEDPSSCHIPPLPVVSSFLSSDDDTTDSDTPDTPSSPTHAPGQPIPHGRPYRYHPNGPIHMMTARKRVRPLPVQQLSVRHYVDRSSSDYSSRHSLSDHSSPDLPSTSARPSCKRRRSPMTYVPALPLVSRALPPVRADLIPLPKRVRDIGYLADVERHRIVGVELAVTALTERVAALERDNRRLRGTASVESQRVDRLQRVMSRMQREMRQMRRFRFYDRVRVGRLEACENGGNENGENEGNGNGNSRGNENGGNRGNENRGNGGIGNHGMNYGGFMPMAEE
nr:hypothetical protein [Tanacetum cinerariifolium]